MQSRPQGASASSEAREPSDPTVLPYATSLRLATLNVRGTAKPGKRDEVEKWMHDDDVLITALQETHSATNSVEKRTRYN